MKSIAYLFYLSAVCSLVSLCWINQPLLVYCILAVIGILPIAAYFIKTFRHNPIRTRLFIYMCFIIAGIGFYVYNVSNLLALEDNKTYWAVHAIFHTVAVVYKLYFLYIIMRLVKRFSFLWWAIVVFAVAIVLQQTLPYFSFWRDYMSYSDFANKYPMFKWMLLSYVSGIAYIVLSISIGNALMPKSLKK